MSAGVLFTCDRVMDEFGSTCPRREYVSADTFEAARLIVVDRGWLLGGSDDVDLCDRHSGRPTGRLKLILDDNVRPIRRASTPVDESLAPVTPIRID